MEGSRFVAEVIGRRRTASAAIGHGDYDDDKNDGERGRI